MTPWKALFLLVAAPLLAQITPDCTYTLKSAPGGSIIVFRNGTALQESDYTRSGSGGLRTITLNGWNDADLMMYYYSAGTSTVVPGTNPPSKITIYLPTKEYRTCTGTQNPPPQPVVQISRRQCVGSGAVNGQGYDCAGIELWAVTANGTTRNYSVVPAPDNMNSLPACPAPGAVCLQPATLGDPPLIAADYDQPSTPLAAYIGQSYIHGHVTPPNLAGICPWLPQLPNNSCWQ